MKLAALIIAYHSERHIGDCLESCLRHRADFPAGILVIDNASQDATREVVRRFAGVDLQTNAENLGFAGAVNQGFWFLRDADAILLLNPDTRLVGSPALLAGALAKDGRIGVGAGMLVGDDGKPQTGFQVRRFPTATSLSFELLGLNRLWPSNPVNRRYRALDLDPGLPADVDQPAGACLLIRRAAWLGVGGFDEGFHPLWFEDVDFLRRLSGSGWRIVYRPEFRAVHSGGHSIRALPWGARQLYWYTSLYRYSSRHLSALGRGVVFVAGLLGMAPRMVAGIFQNRTSQVVGVYGTLVRLASKSLMRERTPILAPTIASQAVGETCGPSRPGNAAD